MKRVKIGLLIIAIGLIMNPLAYAADNLKHKVVLENGMTVLVHEMPASHMISIYMLVKTGSATEGDYLGTGISHFLEHMLFKGTDKRRVGKIAEEVQALGGRINASTSYDYTIYTLDVPRKKFREGFDIISDMIMNSVIDPKETKKEQEVIVAEMRLHNDRPERRLGQMLFNNAYTRHPYRHPIIGYVPLFKKLTHRDLVDYYQTHYIPNNMILSIAGNVNFNEIQPIIEDAYKNFQPKPYSMRALPEEPQQVTQKRVEQDYPTGLTRLSMAYQSVSVLNQDLYPLDVLAMALGRGQSSRFFLRLYQELGILHSISAGNYTPMDKGLFLIDAMLEAENTDKVVTEVKNVIEEIKTSGLTDEELEKTKRQVLSRHIFDNQTASSIAYEMAVDEAFTGDFHFSEKYVDEIKNVTNEDIQRVANKYLKDNFLTIAVLKPPFSTGVKESVKENATYTIQKFTKDNTPHIKNGLTVLLREDPTFPTVSIVLALEGGLRQEPENFQGISNLTSRLWIKGTKKRSSEQLAEEIERLGASLSYFSGKNSFGLTLNLLSEDMDYALNLMEELIKEPSFPEDELVKAKKQTMAVLLAQQDSIAQMTSLSLKEKLFEDHPYGRNELGTEESIKKITQNDIVNFYKTLAVPDNMVLTIMGDIDAKDLLNKIGEKFGGIPGKTFESKKYELKVIPETKKEVLHMDKQQAMIMIGFRGPTISNADRYGLEVLTTILGSPLSGRMFAQIREELGDAYTMSAGIVPGIDTGYIEFYVLTDKEAVDNVLDIVHEEIEKIKNELVSKVELAGAKSYLKGTFERNIETNSSLAMHVAFDELYNLGYNEHQLYEKRIDAVTVKDIQDLANKYLDFNKSVTVVTLPAEQEVSSEQQLEATVPTQYVH